MIKTAIVTGFSGFLGTTFTKKLLNEGWKVYGIDKFTYVHNKSLIRANLKNFTWVQTDVANLNSWLPECDVIFNFAAESDVDIGNQSCEDFIHSNVNGVRNLLDMINKRIVLRVDKPLFFQISTDEVYGDLTNGSFNESSQMKPSNPYAASKAMADLLIQAYSRTYDINYIIARPSNNYGYYQYPEKLIPLAVKRLSRGKKIKLHDEGKPIRTWTHSEDTANAILTLYEKAERNCIYNISSEFEQTNLETVNKILSAYFMGSITRQVPDSGKFLDFTYNRPGQDIRYSISCNPLKSLGWSAEKNFDEEIVALVQHYKKEFTW